MTRTRASIFHLVLSLVLLAACAGLVLLLWYPYPFRELQDSGRFSLLLIGCVVIIGPALTWLVNTPGKRRRALVFDLVVIGLVQLSAMSWGMYNLSVQKPFFMVFAVDRFEVHARGDVTYPVSNPAFLDRPFDAPVMLYASMPTDTQRFQKLLQEVMFEGKPDLPLRPEFWSAYADRQQLVLKVSQPLLELRKARPAAAADIDALVQDNGGDIAGLHFIPGMMGHGSFTVVVDAGSGVISGYLDADPWIKE